MNSSSAPFAYDAFLSHNNADKERVRRLADRLKAEGVRVWFDEWAIKPGDNIVLGVEQGLEQSRTLVLCLSAAALGSEWVGLERSTALFRNPSNSQRRFVPLLLSNCKIPEMLRCYSYIDYRQEEERAFDELVQSCTGKAKEKTDATNEGLQAIQQLFTARRNEWKRLRADFEAQAAKYSDLRLKVIVRGQDGLTSKDNVEGTHYCINLWQYYGAGTTARDRLKAMFNLTKFGMVGAEVTAFGIIIGKDTDLFCKMANRAGSLLPHDIDRPVWDNVRAMFDNAADDAKSIVVANRNPLAKWLNTILLATRHAHPERIETEILPVDPFTASLTVFDLFLPFTSS